MTNFVKIASVNDIKPGESKIIKAMGAEIALFNVGGEFHALENLCPHRGGPLGEGMLDNSTATCPWHGWRFNVTTGASSNFPNIHVKRYHVKVEGDDVLLQV